MAAELPAHSWVPVDLATLDAEPSLPELSGLLYAGRRHLVSGLPEAAKTWLALILAVEQLRAGECVVWVDFEMGAKLVVERLEALGMSKREEEFSQFALLAPSEPLTPGSLVEDDVRSRIEGLRPRLVVFDAMTGALELHGLSSKDDVHVEAIYRKLFDLFRAHGAAVVILDHVNKDPESRNGFATGSQRKSGAADVHLGLEAVKPFGRGRTALVKIRTHKDRPGALPRPHAGELALISDPNCGGVSWELRLKSEPDTESQFRPTVLMGRVSQFLEASQDAQTRAAIEEAVTGKASFIRQAIDVLRDEGNVVERPGPKGARLVELVVPYREADELRVETTDGGGV
jgi:hypothetical protein